MYQLNNKLKNWVWIETDLQTSESEWQKKFNLMRRSGINAVLPEIFNSFKAFYKSKHLPLGGEFLEKILPLAKSEGLEVHAWMWTMPCNVPEVLENHPEWYVVNRNGESSAIKPAYVKHYKFLCASQEKVQLFIENRVKELSEYNELDGVHIDFIRYPDVIIAKALQPKYKVVQDKEYSPYDYCYCNNCQNSFKEKTGYKPTDVDDPTQNDEWRKFRYDNINNLVNNRLIPIAKKNGKKITAAVFPNWESVRQQWFEWKLDAFLPMLYHNFYNGDIEWIKDETKKGISNLANRAPLYSGLFIPELDPKEFIKAVEASIDAGANGVSIYHEKVMTEKHWESLDLFMKSVGKN